jgi:hypothetical protein
MTTLELLLIGAIIGYISNPIGNAIYAVCSNAWREYIKDKTKD